MMSDSTQSKPVKERLTFNWPTKSPSKISLTNPQIDMALPEVKLPVKQRVVFPSDRFNNNNNNGNNSQRFQRDDSWDSMGDVFLAPPSSPPNPWAVGSDNHLNSNCGYNKRDDGFSNRNNNNKRRRFDQRDKRNNNHDNFNNNGCWSGGESNGNGNNSNRGSKNNSNPNSYGNKCQPVKPVNNGWEFDTNCNRKRKESGEDGNLEIDWSSSVTFNENENSNCPVLSRKSIATQTDLITTQSIGVQTDFKLDSGYYTQIGGQQKPLGFYTESIISSTTSSITNTDHKESGSLIVNKFDSNERNNQSNGPMMMIPENSLNPLHRDPRVARRAKSFQLTSSN